MIKQVIYWSIFTVGLLIMSLGIALMIKANLGSAPWDVFHIGLYKHFGLTIGTWSIIVGFIILGTTAILSRKLPSIGAFVNMVLVGIFIDMYLGMPWIETPDSIGGKLIMLVMGILINGIGMGVYISANRGAGPRDTLMLYLAEVTHWKIAPIRRIMELGVLIIGFILGGPVNIGTILFGLTIGTIVGWALPFCQKLVNHWVERGVQVENFNKGPIRLNNNDGAR